MCEVINLAEYRKEKQLKAELKSAVNNLSKISDKEEFDYCFLKILDRFFEEYDPSIYWRFEVFLQKIINQK